MADNEQKALQFIEEMTLNADAVQKNVLAEILTHNAQTEYLKGFNLDGATDRETFKSKIPMVTYEDIQPLIRRIADGDRSPILTVNPISESSSALELQVVKESSFHVPKKNGIVI